MKELDALRAELDRWHEAGREATLWWRDDDAEAPDAPVLRMLELSARHGAGCFIAAVPARAVDALGPAIVDCPTAVPFQHGWAHEDHSPAAVKGKWELGLHRPKAAILDELRRGRARMAELFGARDRPMLGPPWNRIAPELCADLPALGFEVLSTFAPRPCATPAPGLRQVNGHVDIISWKRGRSFIGAEKTANRLADHLAQRRRGEVEDEPTGLLTHVWINDEPAWEAIDAVLGLVAAHPAARWLDDRSFFQ
ncbi:polysaccharide deacetylase family protein [Minwuia thermotolerans]|uniref:polysaccharide deacetylase family protein n=1 Tax=Minwuia thermotolerans TaxID=2056226 RepID=UPI0013DE0BE6|nr:polysaccharide deacetylase family protein [Minwuia thermotolerans]